MQRDEGNQLVNGNLRWNPRRGTQGMRPPSRVRSGIAIGALAAFGATGLAACSGNSGQTNSASVSAGGMCSPSNSVGSFSVPNSPSTSTSSAASPSSTSATTTTIAPGGKLSNAARLLLGSVKHTSYTSSAKIDTNSGTFNLDCSQLVNYLVSTVEPYALKTVAGYASLGQSTSGSQDLISGPESPTALTYAEFFASMPPSSSFGYWSRVANISDIANGDVVAWGDPSHKSGDGSYVGVVVGYPRTYTGSCHVPSGYVGLQVPVLDSVQDLHGSGDSRALTTNHGTGVGRGDLVLVGTTSGRVLGYWWATGQCSAHQPPDIAIGRLQ